MTNSLARNWPFKTLENVYYVGGVAQCARSLLACFLICALEARLRGALEAPQKRLRSALELRSALQNTTIPPRMLFDLRLSRALEVL